MKDERGKKSKDDKRSLDLRRDEMRGGRRSSKSKLIGVADQNQRRRGSSRFEDEREKSLGDDTQSEEETRGGNYRFFEQAIPSQFVYMQSTCTLRETFHGANLVELVIKIKKRCDVCVIMSHKFQWTFPRPSSYLRENGGPGLSGGNCDATEERKGDAVANINYRREGYDEPTSPLLDGCIQNTISVPAQEATISLEA